MYPSGDPVDWTGSGPRVLAVTYGGGHFNITRNVVMALEKMGASVLVLALTTARQGAARWLSGLRVVGVHELLASPAFERKMAQKIQETGNAAMAVSGIESHAYSMDETVAYLGAGIHGLMSSSGMEMDSAIDLFRTQGRRVLEPVSFARTVLKWLKPDAVFATNSPRMESAFLREADVLGIRTVCCCDMVGNTEIVPLSGRIICVANEIAKKNLIAQGYDSSQIIITGQPALDWTASIYRARRFMEDGFLRILYPSQPTGREAQILRIIEEVGDERGNFRVIATVHPGYLHTRSLHPCSHRSDSLESSLVAVTDSHEKGCEQELFNNINGSGGNDSDCEDSKGNRRISGWMKSSAIMAGVTRPLLFECDLVVAEYTTVILEALSLGIPVLALDIGRDPRIGALHGLAGLRVVTASDFRREVDLVVQKSVIRSVHSAEPVEHEAESPVLGSVEEMQLKQSAAQRVAQLCIR
ncbi:MAG: hypothetical protein CVV64_01750 [Candidatus Wallbacteria bacterium HGW-Wallbacteria-1]|jgi:hypothetical protein|uniref:UDP-N-acetylglucosamine 2-epimerase domain-containing protein n=1 Tax=Candidatus Wallbacteria bacterium HGW-Wallbacteria-1 TaxID=2013854 RepID=A0A2N1PV22_9BACT|nr:MAG: hypothetical protein CVV64_01750 [Candidatus Wallbacteria bacterium HGW-Wallbacteria-1]